MIDTGLLLDAVKSEWIKLRSVRSTYWTIIIAIALGIGLSAAISAANAHSYRQLSVSDKITFDPTAISLFGLAFAQLALGVMAILMISSEYTTGTIRTTFSAVPQRGYVLAAKSLIAATVCGVVALGISFAAFFLGQVIFGADHLSVSLSHPGVLRAVLGGGLYMAGLVLFALGLASIIRSTAGSITALAGLVFILPGVSQALPATWQHDLARYFPANAGGAINTVVPNPSNLTPWVGYGVFLIWIAVLLGVGWLLLRRRDV